MADLNIDGFRSPDSCQCDRCDSNSRAVFILLEIAMISKVPLGLLLYISEESMTAGLALYLLLLANGNFTTTTSYLEKFIIFTIFLVKLIFYSYACLNFHDFSLFVYLGIHRMKYFVKIKLV